MAENEHGQTIKCLKDSALAKELIERDAKEVSESIKSSRSYLFIGIKEKQESTDAVSIAIKGAIGHPIDIMGIQEAIQKWMLTHIKQTLQQLTEREGEDKIDEPTG